MSAESLNKLKELKDLSRALYIKLEEDGLRVSHAEAGLAKEQLFTSNIKNIINATEGLLRGEASEGHMMRLDKEFPDSLKNIQKLCFGFEIILRKPLRFNVQILVQILTNTLI